MSVRVPSQMQNANLKTICSECEQLQGQLNAATDVIKVTANSQRSSLGMLHDLDNAHNARDRAWQKFVEHLKTHTRAAAA